ncbi:MAG: hypothetical protein JRJ42_11475 [Deltaproteobacteria bacterium]|nr:hypothetical protein [Deltaproteobacteria bacterium]MBW2075909.1 hypothetical protein [Deltaproteobacteria bacterium]
MTTSLFLIFNHQITEIQEKDARESLGVDRILDLPSDLKDLWSQIPSDLHKIMGYLEPVKKWLKSHATKNDYVLIQGDFGACYIIVNFAFEIGLIPIYSTTRRAAVEKHENDGSVKLIHQFNHQMFRKYGS